jgi:hypothetical protein
VDYDADCSHRLPISAEVLAQRPEETAASAGASVILACGPLIAHSAHEWLAAVQVGGVNCGGHVQSPEKYIEARRRSKCSTGEQQLEELAYDTTDADPTQ